MGGFIAFQLYSDSCEICVSSQSSFWVNSATQGEEIGGEAPRHIRGSKSGMDHDREAAGGLWEKIQMDRSGLDGQISFLGVGVCLHFEQQNFQALLLNTQ